MGLYYNSSVFEDNSIPLLTLEKLKKKPFFFK